MNALTSQQRKLAYIIGILVLIIPIIWLGAPGSGQADASAASKSGGKLAQLRVKHDLGEQNLGDVDPTSATMNLVLLGLRGLATNLLWMEHEEQKKTKNWAQMRDTTESIIMLQPHYMQVWRYHGWDLAYNVSSEWDAVEDRYYWVKEGTKFIMKGTVHNQKYTDLFFDAGTFLGQKMGRSDEWRMFRKFFNPAGYPMENPENIGDPDPKFKGGPDPELNPDGRDNYLAAQQWYTKASEKESSRIQKIMARELFLSYPMRSQLDYAGVLNREGTFNAKSREAWNKGHIEWTENYGRMLFPGPKDSLLYMNATEEEMKLLAIENDLDVRQVSRWIEALSDITNFRYWSTRSKFEADEGTQDAHRELYEGEQLFSDGEIAKAQTTLESGMKHFADVLRLYGSLRIDDNMIEEGLWAVLLWQKTLQLQGLPVPENFPLQAIWMKEIRRVPGLQADFNRRFGGI